MTDRLHIPKGKYARTGYVSPIDAALEIIGGKYKVSILYYIRESVLRFGELCHNAPGLLGGLEGQKSPSGDVRERDLASTQASIVQDTIYS
jgi:hypothetical protein